MTVVEINNLTRAKVDERFLKRVAKIVLKGENTKVSDLSVALVGEKEIKFLNSKYRKKNKATDVLSFEGTIGLGEVVICPSQVKNKKEFARVLIHGILNLFGREHDIKKENYYLSLIFS